MKRYTPSRERVWAEWNRRQRVRKMKAVRAARGLPESLPTPPNSTPWLRHPPRSLDDLRFISEQVRQSVEAWKSEFFHSSGS
jgi:hypothetical protein